ncbi:predicted protein [Botrytis cinerea T4]|uniref:Uncharacterized protein n=1 Tax=Botryotinia fuckeliana (strain T4) TaxID=999810 RepID=G2Y860_BOTF4|nr:predicted protein [Botrytis cinerea T4]
MSPINVGKLEFRIISERTKGLFYKFLMQTIVCGSIRRSMFSGGVLNWKKLTKYPRLLPEVVNAINHFCTTITKSSPTPPLDQSRHVLSCEARLRNPEKHSVL